MYNDLLWIFIELLEKMHEHCKYLLVFKKIKISLIVLKQNN